LAHNGTLAVVEVPDGALALDYCGGSVVRIERARVVTAQTRA